MMREMDCGVYWLIIVIETSIFNIKALNKLGWKAILQN